MLRKVNTINHVSHEIDTQRLLILQLLKNDLDFLRFESVNSDYFITGQSAYLRKRDSLNVVIDDKLVTLTLAMHDSKMGYATELANILDLLHTYDSTFNTLVGRINARGFKDFGLEGKMRTFAHKLEDFSSQILLSDVLTLRRHEKDFMLRKEHIYIEKFNALVEQLVFRLQVKTNSPIIDVLTSYQQTFNALTALSYEIGIHPKDGLQGLLNNHVDNLSSRLNALSVKATAKKDEVIAESIVVFVVASIVLVLISILLTYYTSTLLANPIKKLSGTMSKFLVHEGLNEKDLDHDEGVDEINQLSQSFIRLSRELKRQFSEVVQQNKELKKLNNELDRFIYSVGHDLKSPLASLEGLIQLADREIDSKEHRHYFRMMSNAVAKLDSFIRDITDYARNKRQQLHVEKLDIEVMVAEVIEGLMFLPYAHQLDVSISFQGSILYTDKTRLEIVLKNLLANSFRYMDPSKEHCYLRIEGKLEGDFMRITVSDNGIGIDKEHLDKIFDMFYRATETSNGTGIGLFLVKESVKMLRGRISVKSEPGRWTQFQMVFPNIRLDVSTVPETEGVFEEA